MSEERGSGKIDRSCLLVKIVGDPKTYCVTYAKEHAEAAELMIAQMASTFCDGGVLQLTPCEDITFKPRLGEPEKEPDTFKPMKWVAAQHIREASEWASKLGLLQGIEWLPVMRVEDLPTDANRKQLLVIANGTGNTVVPGTTLHKIVQAARTQGFKIVKVTA